MSNSRPHARRFLSLAACCLLAISIERAEEPAPPTAPPAAPPRPYHHITGFAGLWLETVTAVEFSDETRESWEPAPTFGLGYEYRTSQNKGILFFLQRTGGDVSATVLGGGVGIHSETGWWFLVGSAWERREDGSSGKLRFGINREFRVGGKKRTTMTPSLTFDLAEDRFVTILGVSVGRLF